MRAAVQGPNALVVSGGSSLGVYEAGVLYYITLVQASAFDEVRGAEAVRFSVASGTSAGAINAFMAAMATCQQPNPEPRASPFWLWTTVDWNDLLAEKRDTGEVNACGRLDGALTRRPIRGAVARLDQAWTSYRWRSCEVRFGAAVTYLTPLLVPLRPPGPGSPSTIEVSRLTERFAFRMTSDGGPAVLHAFPGNGEPGFPILAPTTTSGTLAGDPLLRERKDVMELLLASSGIPVAFDPLPLQVVYEPGGAASTHCFVDGGVLDNVPLSTAIRLLENLPASARGGGRPTYVYVDAANTDPAAVPPSGAGPGAPSPKSRRSMVGDLGGLLGDLITGARQAELADTIADNREVRESLELPRRKHFITGELLGAFGAFFDESFRRYDFFAGMADAERSLGPSFETVRGARPPAVDAPEFACFRAVWRVDGAEAIREALHGPECAHLRPSPEDEGTEARLRRDLWRLLSIIGPGDLDGPQPRLAYRFLRRLDRATGPEGAGWKTGYEYVTLRNGRKLAKGDGGLIAVREQLQELSNRLSEQLQSGAGLAGLLYTRLAATAGSELADSALARRRIPWSLSIGLFGKGAEVSLARKISSGEPVGLDLAGGIQLADFALERREIPWYTDFHVFFGPRAEIRLTRISPLELLVGGYVVGQGGYSQGRRPIYRLGVSLRTELQAFQRIYGGLSYTNFFEEADRFRQADWSGSFGLRLWL